MKNKTATKVISYLVAVTMIAGTISLSPVTTTEVQAAATAKNVNLSISNSIAGITNPTSTNSSTAWEGTTVYYGDKAYYVLDKDGGLNGHSSKSGHMLLLLKGVLELSGRKFDDVNSDWNDENCDIRNDLNGDYFLNQSNGFTTTEKSAIGETAINQGNTDNGGYTSYPTGERSNKIFLLDRGDLQNTAYGFTNNGTAQAEPACTNWWWLRSPGNTDDKAMDMKIDGLVVDGHSVTVTNGSARPALNLKLSSVIFSSAAGASKSAFAAVGSDQVGTNTWKLTLQDGNNGFAATRTDSGGLSGGTVVSIKVNSLGNIGSNYKIAAMLVDSSKTVLCYGWLNNGNVAATGNYSFTIPAGTNGGNRLYVFAEQMNSGNQTDYASRMVDVSYGPSTPEPEKDNNNNDTTKKSEETYVNPLSWLYAGKKEGSLCVIEQQGPICKTAFKTATPAGYTEAFSFNLSILENGVMKPSYTRKTKTLVLYFPREYQKHGRTFALIGIDRFGNTKIFTDEDLSDGSITTTLDIGGYAFSLIYTDGD